MVFNGRQMLPSQLIPSHTLLTPSHRHSPLLCRPLSFTTGACSIYGHLMPDDLTEIRKSTGICPQQNVLFPSLTVMEHLSFFGVIKVLAVPLAT